MPAPVQDGYSAKTAVELFVDGECVDVAQVGPNSITLREAREDLVNKSAVLSITVGHSRKRLTIVITGRSESDPRELRYY